MKHATRGSLRPDAAMSWTHSFQVAMILALAAVDNTECRGSIYHIATRTIQAIQQLTESVHLALGYLL